jgi:pimeloyl-ACP methyl ester carboxylesterase
MGAHVVGEGEPLVLVHGLSGSRRWWDAVLPALSARYACHLLDVPRFGTAFRPEQTAAWLGEYADEAGLRGIRLVGHSLGGAAAARLAALRPELVRALVLVSAAGMPSGRRPGGFALPLVAALRTTTPSFLARLTADALRTGPDALVRGWLYAARVDVREQARAISAPTLLVWGDRDTLVPSALADEWRRAIPQARLVVLEGVGHVPMVEQPDAFAQALLDFLDEPGDVVRRGPVGRVGSAGDDREPPAR